MPAFGPRSGDLTVHTGRQGAAAVAGHDLVLRAGRWEATLDPDGRGGHALTLTAWPESLEVVEAHGGAKPLSDRDRRDIRATIAKKVLGTEPVRCTAAGAGTLTGELTIAGRSAPCEVHLQVTGDRVSGEATVVQSHFGIKPYSAFLGALKVADAVQVRFTGSGG